jgi:hypothetical protein
MTRRGQMMRRVDENEEDTKTKINSKPKQDNAPSSESMRRLWDAAFSISPSISVRISTWFSTTRPPPGDSITRLLSWWGCQIQMGYSDNQDEGEITSSKKSRRVTAT